MKLKQIILLSIGLSLIVSSCRKDKLEGEKELLKGKWNWAFTIKGSQDQTEPGIVFRDTIWADDCVDTYRLDFLEKGIVKSINNGDLFCRKRIVFSEFSDVSNNSSSNLYGFIIELNGKDQKTLEGNILGEDSIFTKNTDFTNLPFRDNPSGEDLGDIFDVKYTHFYVKE